LNNFHEYPIQHSFKSGDTSTKDHFRWVKLPGTTLYWKPWLPCVFGFSVIWFQMFFVGFQRNRIFTKFKILLPWIQQNCDKQRNKHIKIRLVREHTRKGWIYQRLIRSRKSKDRQYNVFLIITVRSFKYWLHYVIKFVSDLRQVSGFLRVLRFSPPIKLTATI
jgi:hypothetical protein